MDALNKIRVVTGPDLSEIAETVMDVLVVVDRDTNIVNGTCPMPINPYPKQFFIITSRVEITNLTMNANSVGRTIHGNITSLLANTCAAWVYEDISNAWFPLFNALNLDALQAAINAKLSANGDGSALTGLTKTQVGLANVDNTSDASKPVSTATQTALNLKMGDDRDTLAYAALGSPILAETVGQKLFYSNVSTNLVDNQIKYTAVYLPKAATITGVRFWVRVLGAYTADNNNRVGLYSYLNGTLTLVASSANSGTLWTSAANAAQIIPFSSPYVAAAGIYFVAFLYNNSVQSTAPALASGIALNNAGQGSTGLGFTNSAKLHGTSTGNDLPASIAMSAVSASGISSWVAIY